MEKKILVLDKDTLEFKEVVVETESNEVPYEEMRKAVDGYIEHVTVNRAINKANIDMWRNEEGKLDGLKPSVMVVEKAANGEIEMVELLAGNILFTTRYEEKNSGFLSDEQIKFVKEQFSETTEMGMAIEDDGDVLGFYSVITNIKIRLLKYK